MADDFSTLDATDYYADMQSLSASLSAVPANGATGSASWGGVFFTGSDAALNVFTLDLDNLILDPWVTALNTYVIDVPAGSTVVINVLGDTSGAC